MNYYADPDLFQEVVNQDQPIEVLFQDIPTVAIPNYMFSGEGSWTLRMWRQAGDWVSLVFERLGLWGFR